MENWSDLFVFLVYLFEDMLIRGIAKTTVYPSLLIVLKSLAKSLWTVVKGIAKGFMDAIQIAPSHEDLSILDLMQSYGLTSNQLFQTR